ncbi:MAG: RagB/SusD family nutrient uptake outer membrane protein [Gemmatimonadota bacterium]|nr:RagB/SusD family nutrient uptake outer membrane protein [Gemmatimonadota bacterium]
MNRLFRALGLCAALAVGGVMAGCDIDSLLEVSNPERIDESELQSRQLVQILYNSVLGEFTDMYDDPFIWRGSMFTDEQITGINWEQTARLSQRIVRFDEGDPDIMFSAISAARATADSVSSRFRELLDDPATDERMATVLAYAGYSHIIMGEAMCEAVVDVGSEILSPTQIFERGIPRLEEALQLATNNGFDDVADLARTGLARANLNLGNASEAMLHAQDVTPGFTWWVEYQDAGGGTANVLWDRVTGSNHAVGVHPNFLAGTFGDNGIIATQTDPRVQHTSDWSLGHNRLTRLYKPYQSLPYSGYNGAMIADGGEPVLYESGTDIRLASDLEALHHYYEAAGPNGTGPAGTTLDFVNARRAFGNQAAVSLADDALMAELRDQRGRDLYMGGFRLGDLRRWLANGTGDFFPSGNHPTTEWGAYGDATCYPLPLEEYEGNPNLTPP